MKGRVKSFDEGKGYGFIEGEDGKEYLVVFTEVSGSTLVLTENTEVQFEPVDTPKGPQAAKVRRIDTV